MVYVPTGRPRGRPRKDGSVGTVVAVARSTVPKKRGRKPKTDNKFFIGLDTVDKDFVFTFPIVQEETTRKPAAYLTVGALSFHAALKDAIRWAKEYSVERSASYWPLVKYKALDHVGIVASKRYVKRLGGSHEKLAYAESADVGAWLHIDVLEVV